MPPASTPPPIDDASVIAIDRPHDSLFRFVFARVEHAAAVLRTFVPARIAARIDWSTLALESASFVDPAFARAESDLLFSVLLDGTRAYLYVLFEHQSSGDRTMNVRLVGYEAHIWKRWLDEGHGPDEPLPAILPIVLAHAEPPWPHPTRLGEQYALSPADRRAFGAHLLDVEAIIVDLARISRSALLDLPMLTDLVRLALLVLKCARSSLDLAADLIPFATILARLARDALGSGRRDVAAIFRYIRAVSPSPTDRLQHTLRLHAGAETEELFVTSAQQLLAQGRTEGRAEERAATLARLLTRKFGPVDASVRARIDATSADELVACLDRILTATTVAEVFAPST